MNRFRRRIGHGPPVVIAHRGDSYHAPENTLEAARAGHNTGAFAWELDVHRTRDGVPVVIHDDTLERTTDVATKFAGDPRAADRFRVAEFDWAEVRTLDAGSWFVDPAGPPRSAATFGTLDRLTDTDRRRFSSGTIAVPTLTDALELTRDLDWLVNVELKTFPESDPDLLESVLDAIDQTRTAERVLLSSFDHHDIARAARFRPDIASAVLCDTPILRATDYARVFAGVDFLHTSAAALGAESLAYRAAPSASALRALEAHEAPVPTLVYTVNDARPEGLAAHLATLGVAGVFTDDPAGLRQLWPR